MIHSDSELYVLSHLTREAQRYGLPCHLGIIHSQTINYGRDEFCHMHFIFMGFILCGFPIFTDFAFLNWQMLVTVVFAYLWVKYL